MFQCLLVASIKRIDSLFPAARERANDLQDDLSPVEWRAIEGRGVQALVHSRHQTYVLIPPTAQWRNFALITFCDCPRGRQARVCEHGWALLFKLLKEYRKNPQQVIGWTSGKVRILGGRRARRTPATNSRRGDSPRG